MSEFYIFLNYYKVNFLQLSFKWFFCLFVCLFGFLENVFFTSYVICSFRKTFKENSQKQPFTDVLQNRCSLKFLSIRKKTLVLESRLDKVAGLKACIFIKKEIPTNVFFCDYCGMFKNCFLVEHLLFITHFRKFMW